MASRGVSRLQTVQQMGCGAMTAVLVSIGVYFLLTPPSTLAAPAEAASAPAQRRRLVAPYILIDDPLDPLDMMDVAKRPAFDDYGHMRFGKRGMGEPEDKFDDYGHMRFGRGRNV